jgi:hypothetical protein
MPFLSVHVGDSDSIKLDLSEDSERFAAGAPSSHWPQPEADSDSHHYCVCRQSITSTFLSHSIRLQCLRRSERRSSRGEWTSAKIRLGRDSCAQAGYEPRPGRGSRPRLGGGVGGAENHAAITHWSRVCHRRPGPEARRRPSPGGPSCREP